jgi:hypothetical protein
VTQPDNGEIWEQKQQYERVIYAKYKSLSSMDGTDVISDGLASLQLTEKLISQKEKLLEEMRQVMSMASDVIEGFSPPYVKMSSRKLLKRFLHILLKYRKVFQSVDISISDEIMSEAEFLHLEIELAVLLDRKSINLWRM